MTEKLILKRYKHCKFSEQGCLVRDTLENLQKHEPNCLFHLVQCKFHSNGCQRCQTKFWKGFIETHESKCEFRIFKCKFSEFGCLFEHRQMNVLELHEFNCQFKTQQCQWNRYGCVMELPLEQMTKHVKRCRFAAIKCVYCNTDVSLNSLENHPVQFYKSKCNLKIDKHGHIYKSNQVQRFNPVAHIVQNIPPNISDMIHFVVYSSIQEIQSCSVVMIWVEIFGLEVDAEKFNFSVKIYNSQKVIIISYCRLISVKARVMVKIF